MTDVGFRVGHFVPPPPPKTAKAAGTRRRLLETASELFITQGYEAVSMRDIAAAAGLTKSAIYGHFRAKGQLLVEVIRWRLAEVEHNTDFAAAEADPVNGVRLLFDESGRDARLLQIDAAAAARHDPEVMAGLVEMMQERLALVTDVQPDASDPQLAAWFVIVLTWGIAAWEASGQPVPDADRLAPALLSAMTAIARQPNISIDARSGLEP